MSYAQLGIIEANDYNVFVQGGVSSVNHNVANVNTVWGTGYGNKGYGQSSLLSTVSATSTVMASEWGTLINRAKAIMNHQGDSTMSLISAPSSGNIISYINALATAITNGYNNRLTAGSNGTDVTQSPVPSAISWNLPAPTTVQIVYTATWANADQARYFFNAGGKLRLALYATNDGSTTKGSDWADLITNKIGTFILGADSCSRTGSGGTATINSKGYWNLTSSDQTLLSVSSATAAYTSSNITIKVRSNGTQGANGDNGTVITFTIDLSDDGLNVTDSYDDNINISIYNQLNIRPPESTYLTTSIANPSVTRDSYNIDTSGTTVVGGGARSFEYYAPGIYTWTVPAGVTSVRAILVGGGGGGGCSEIGGGSCSGDGGGGGGGGEFVAASFAVTPGHPLQLTVGSGGAGGAPNNDGAYGGTSYIIDLYGTDDSRYGIGFNGSSYLKVNSTAPLNLGSSDFTIEAWVYFNYMPFGDDWPTNYSYTQVVISVGTPSSGDGFSFIVGRRYLMVQNNDVRYLSSTTHKMRANNWYHIACVRYGNNIQFWVGGQNAGSVSFTPSLGTGSGTYIGSETGDGAFFRGEISNLRVVANTALYTSPFAPSRRALTAIAGTTLLACQSSTFIDNSTNNHSITSYGGSTIIDAGTKTTLLTAVGGQGGGAGGNGHSDARGLGGTSGFGGYGDSIVTQYRFNSTGGGHSNAQNCAGGCCAGFDGGDMPWNSGSILQTRANGGYGIRGLGGLAGYYSGGGGGGGASLGDGGRAGNGSGSSPDGRSAGYPGAYGGGGGGSCDEVIGDNLRGSGGNGYVFIEYGTAAVAPTTTNAQIYIIGGGGGGGGAALSTLDGGGGGGGGGGIISQFQSLTPGNYFPVVVGGGGIGSLSNSASFDGTSGSNSSFGTILAYGGGLANGSSYPGGCPLPSTTASTGGGWGRYMPSCSTTSGQGYAGGRGGGSTENSLSDAGGGGGGGGAGGVGAAGTPGSVDGGSGGAGGNGVNLTIAGVTLMYGSGGGGGARIGTGASGASGAGNGGAYGVAGTAGTANRGGGGGGNGTGLSGVRGGTGGSGLVTIVYAGTSPIATGGTIFPYSSGGTDYWVHRFTSSATFGVAPSGTTFAEFLIVGGGGGGRGNGVPPGGGGGTVTIAIGALLSGQSYAVTVGAGGAADGSGGAAGTGGTSSVAGVATSSGGIGGAGGQGGSSSSVIYGTTTNYTGGVNWYTNNQNCGSGAGAGAGGNGESPPSGQNRGGTGGTGYYAANFLIAGTNSSNTPTAIGTPSGGYYGGGGGGGYPGADFGSFCNGLGGAGGGGGNPVKCNTGYPTYGENGLANTGGGGQGGSWPNGGSGGTGGSGIVVLRYSGTPVATGGTITQTGGYTYHTFVSSGTLSVS